MSMNVNNDGDGRDFGGSDGGHQGGGRRIPDEERCVYLKRLRNSDDGRPATDDEGMPLFSRCKKRKLTGQVYCDFHHSREDLKLKDVENRVGHLLREFDVKAQNPMDGLLEVVRYTGGMVRLLNLLVGGLDTEPVTTSRTSMGPDGDVLEVIRGGGLTHWNKDSEEVPNVLVQLYGVWIDRYAKTCALAITAGLDERMVRNAEATTGALYTAVARALVKSDLSLEAQAAFRRALGEELRSLEEVSGPINVVAIEK